MACAAHAYVSLAVIDPAADVAIGLPVAEALIGPAITVIGVAGLHAFLVQVGVLWCRSAC